MQTPNNLKSNNDSTNELSNSSIHGLLSHNEDEIVDEKGNKEMEKETQGLYLSSDRSSKISSMTPFGGLLIQSRRNLRKNNDKKEEPGKKTKKGFLSRCFFKHFDKLFQKDTFQTSITEKDLLNLGDSMKSKNIDKKLKKLIEEMDLEPSSGPKYITQPIIKYILPNLRRAVILNILFTMFSYTFTYNLRFFTTDIKNNKGFSIWQLVSVVSMGFLTLIQGIIKENSNSYTAKSKAATNQALRAIFYDKLKNCNYNFLKEAEISFIAKMMFEEIISISNFYGLIPDLISLPFSLITSFILIYQFIETLVWVPFTIIFVFLMALYVLKTWSVGHRDFFSKMSSNRSYLLNEFLTLQKNVIYDNMESQFEELLLEVRKEEMQTLRTLHMNESFIDFILVLMPIVCSSSSIAFYNWVNKNRDILDASKTYSIVATFNVFSGPFGNIGRALDFFARYNKSVENFWLFIKLIKEHNYEVSIFLFNFFILIY